MIDFKAGKIYREFQTKNEGCALVFDGDVVRIFILFKNPDGDKIKAVAEFDPFFQIYSKNNIIFLLIKFQGLDWLDVPYIHKGVEPKNIQDEAFFCYPVEIFLANSDSGEVILKRRSSFSNGLSKAFYFAIQKQKSHLPKNIEEKINALRASFHPNEIARLSLGK